RCVPIKDAAAQAVPTHESLAARGLIVTHAAVSEGEGCGSKERSAGEDAAAEAVAAVAALDATAAYRLVVHDEDPRDGGGRVAVVVEAAAPARAPIAAHSPGAAPSSAAHAPHCLITHENAAGEGESAEEVRDGAPPAGAALAAVLTAATRGA